MMLFQDNEEMFPEMVWKHSIPVIWKHGTVQEAWQQPSHSYEGDSHAP
jgi:hypothetical protein